jgi:hypothetical protein
VCRRRLGEEEEERKGEGSKMYLTRLRCAVMRQNYSQPSFSYVSSPLFEEFKENCDNNH